MPGVDVCLELTDHGPAEKPCYAFHALSLSDFYGVSFSEFNRKMARCLATPDTAGKACSSITFYDLLPGRL
jgi:hypothetical protein